MVTRGFYRHYKGGLYFVESVGTLHDDTRRIVVYQSAQSVGEFHGVRLRYEDEFEQLVEVGTRMVGDGIAPRHRARFVRIED